MLFLAVVLVGFGLSVDESELTTSNGTTLAGRLASLNENGLKWESTEGITNYSFDEIERIKLTPQERLSTAAASPTVELVDGSRLHPDILQLEGDYLITQVADLKLELPRRDVNVVRFALANDDDQLVQQWREFSQEEASADILALRKIEESADGTGIAKLVKYEGVVLGVDDENVQFRFGETTVPVARSRVFAIRMYQASGRELPEPLCRIQLIDGSQLLVREMRLADRQILLTTAGGMNSEIRTESIAEIDFAFGRLVYLDQLEPSTFEWTPFFASTTSRELLAKINHFRRNQAFDGRPLSLIRPPASIDQDTGDEFGKQPPNAGEQLLIFDHGLALRSHSLLVYSLGGRYSRFAALAGIDPQMRPRGHVELVISGDGRELFRDLVSGEDAGPIPIDVEIQGVQRLSIEVRFGEGLDVSDFLHLGRARVIK